MGWRALARPVALWRVIARFDANRCNRADLPKLLRVFFNGGATDKISISLGPADSHAIKISGIAKALHRSRCARRVKIGKQLGRLFDRQRMARRVALRRVMARCD